MTSIPNVCDGLVLDASLTLAWCFPDESADYADAILQSTTRFDVFVPSIWALEVANALVVAERRGRITQAQTARIILLLRELPIRIDNSTMDASFGQVVALARSANLSAYDASYIELALRLCLPIATIDARLQLAAQSLGIPLAT